MACTFKQYDSRWGNKNYNGSSTMAMAGCGPTACAMVLHSIKKNITPWTTAKYMKAHGYAIWNNGTAQAGIPACLKAFGMKNVKERKTLADTFKAMDGKPKVDAIFLFGAGSRGGVCWTMGGHYMAVTGYKEVNGKHYFYMRDSGGRNHTGWYCYEDHMKGLIRRIWTCEYETTTATAATTIDYPTVDLKIGAKGTQVEKLQKCLQTIMKFSPKLVADGDFGKKTQTAVIKFQKKYGLTSDGVVGSKTRAKIKSLISPR